MQPFNVKIGSSLGKKNKFSLDGKSSSSTHFGHVWPIATRHFVPDSKLKYNDGSIVRLSPLSAPCFGECKFFQYGVSVLYSDLYQHFDNFLAGQSFTTSSSSYLPTTLPSIDRSLLTKLLLRFSSVTIYHTQSGHQDGTNDGDYQQITSPTIDGKQNSLRWVDWLCYSQHSPIFFGKSRLIICCVPAGLASTDNYSKSYSFRFSEHFSSPGFSTPSSCDFRIFVKGSTTNGLTDGTTYCFCFRLSRRGCNLRKILLGLGYKFSLTDSSPVSLFELFAFFKAYFDVFENKRIKTWNQTDCYKLIDLIVQRGYGTINGNSNYADSTYTLLWSVLLSLSETYYTKPSDIYTSVSDTVLPNISGTDGKVVVGNGLVTNVSFSPSELPRIKSGGVSSDVIRYMQRLTTFVTKSSVVGKRLDTLLKKLYGVDTSLFPDSPIVGKSSLDVSISDVVSTSETESGFLGEFAGIGIGKNSGLSVSMDCKSYGIFIVLGSVVPDANWTNGIDMSLLRVGRFDFFNASFDAVGYEMLPVKSFYDSPAADITSSVYRNPVHSLGFVPRYSTWKVSPPDIINGDMSRLCTRDSYLPYLVDSVHTDDFYLVNNLNISNVTRFSLKSTLPKFPIYSPDELRYVGKTRMLSNFDRIFRNSKSMENTMSFGVVDGKGEPDEFLDDLIMLNTVFKCTLYSPMKQISESMDTDPDNYGTEVNKS